MDEDKISDKEILAILMGLDNLIEDTSTVFKDNRFNVEARKIAKDIVASAVSAKRKLEKFTGKEFTIEAYKKGDEKDFINPHIKNPLV